MTCASCKIKLHLNTCSTVTDSHYCYLSAQRKADWNCGPCIRNKGNSTERPADQNNLHSNETPTSRSSFSPRHLNVTFRKKTGKSKASGSPTTLNKSLSNDDHNQTSLNAMFVEIKDLRVTMTSQMKDHDAKLDLIVKLVTELKDDVTELNSKFDGLKTDVDGHFGAVESITDEYSVLKSMIQSNNEQAREMLAGKLKLQKEIATANLRLEMVEKRIKHVEISPPPYPTTATATNHDQLGQTRAEQKTNAMVSEANVPVKPRQRNITHQHRHNVDKTSSPMAPVDPVTVDYIQELCSEMRNMTPSQFQNTNNEDCDWQIYRSRKSKRFRQEVVMGRRQQDQLRTVERTKKLHTCFFKPDTLPGAILSHMESISAETGFEVLKLKLRHERYASFIVTVPESLLQLFMEPESWPEGTEVREWFPRGAGRATYNNRRPNTPGQDTIEKGNADKSITTSK